ncbi:MAG: lipoate--protein ligase family protein [Deltaproteobacteria bacterium]|nr:lipoate--protein ligase family protein [Deltaproteobacteria bacterium]
MSINQPQLPLIRVIPFITADHLTNMATDELMLSMETPALRFYCWSQASLSLGKSPTLPDDIDYNYCKNNKIPIFHRLSGGQAVLHHLELTYCFAADVSFFPPQITETYQIICEPLLRSMEKLGLDPAMSPFNPKLNKSSICFNEISNYELSVKNKKIIGSAQHRRKKRFFQHGSILLDIDFELWKKIWKLEQNSQLLNNRITTLKEQLGVAPANDDLVEIFQNEFLNYFRAEGYINPLDHEECASVKILTGKYARLND